MTSDIKVIEGGLGHDDKDEAIRVYRLTRERLKPRLHVVQPMNIIIDGAAKIVDFKLRR